MNREDIARAVWLEKSAGDSYWSHMIAPNCEPDEESYRIADAVLELIEEPA